ncbi:hypothetical protein TI39_contig530g00005 [Zymoseptoria brevis]|uniref:Uncharacterized protein n=1 Tax=Zymoseptoria brevis TaxID=1047168 RepID=A0A0F4GIE7_9PEZI|nr:hypothetical protein TI39_contig530g00005 [Zymoseptoria brevis]
MTPAKRNQTKAQLVAEWEEDIRDSGMKKTKAQRLAEIKEKEDAWEAQMAAFKAAEKLKMSFLACGCLYFVVFALAAGFSHAYRDFTPVPWTFKK